MPLLAVIDALAAIGAAASVVAIVAVTRIRAIRDGEPVEQPEHRQLRNMALAWSGTRMLEPDAPREAAEIGAHSTLQVDLIHVNEALPEQLHPDIRPRLRPHDPQWLDERAVELDLAVSGDEIPTTGYTVTVTLEQPLIDTTGPAKLSVKGPAPRTAG